MFAFFLKIVWRKFDVVEKKRRKVYYIPRPECEENSLLRTTDFEWLVLEIW